MNMQNTNLFSHSKESIEDQVYGTLLDDRIPEYMLPWVKPIFYTGHPCHETYSRMHDAYSHLRERLGEPDEDKDAEIMIDALLEHGKILAYEMFHYGRVYQIIQDKEKTGA